MKEALLQIIATFDNVNVKSNAIGNIRFRFPFSEIGNYSKLLMNIGQKMKGIIVTEDEKVKLGNIVYKQLSIDKDGEAKFVVEGMSNEMELDKIYSLVEKAITLKVKVIVNDGEANE